MRFAAWLSACMLMVAGPGHAAQLLIESETGLVLEAVDASAPRYPASLTKMMTVWMALKAIVSDKLTMLDELTVSRHAASMPPTKLGLIPGETILLEDAIRAAIVRSANDAAVVVAEAVGGNEADFAAAMTREAKRLGMTQSEFHNASGLPHPQQRTSARDMAILGRALYTTFPEYFHLFGSHFLAHAGRRLRTYNGLVRSYGGADGIKTGFTCASGYNVVTSAERDGRHLIGVVLGATSKGGRMSTMQRMLDSGFSSKRNGEARTLADLRPDATELAAEPPVVLNSGRCGPAPEPDDAPDPRSNARWAVSFGSFAKKKDASAALRKATSVIKSIAEEGRATVVETKKGKLKRYAAMVTGLEADEAAKGCQLLRKKKSFCLTIKPAAVNNPKARGR